MIRNTTNKCYDIPDDIKIGQGEEILNTKYSSAKDLIEFLHKDEIGKDQTFLSAFGWRQIVYCDWSASGRGLRFINNYVTETVLPWYANTHSMANTTATQISMFREEARQIVRQTVNADSDKDSVIFHGNGTTGVIALLKHIIDADKSIFIVGEETHHSLYTPWKDVTDNVVLIPDSPDRDELLEEILSKIRQQYKDVPVFGCFAGVSNVTGKIYDVENLAQIMHRFGGYIVVDYATGAPYVEMNMNPVVKGTYKDAIVFSPHKFLGGIESPGVLVAKKGLFRNKTPVVSGGGTVFFVKEQETSYFKAPELREEGGTPNIIGSIRAALACYVKLNVGVDVISTQNEEIVRRVQAEFSKSDNILLLGEAGCPQIPLFSFLVKHESLYLHHNYVVTLLNDLFGIQTRGGCLCAGPYVQNLLGMDSKLTKSYLDLLSEDPDLDRHHLRRTKEYSSYEMFRPGVVRLSISYTTPSDTVDFIIKAVTMVADQGWKLLPFYRCNHETGEWHHLSNLQFNNRRWLSHLKITGEKITQKHFPENDGLRIEECLDAARNIFKGTNRYNNSQDSNAVFDDAKDLRWFLLPADIVMKVNHSRPIRATAPFTPSPRFTCLDRDRYRQQQLDAILSRPLNSSGELQQSTFPPEASVVPLIVSRRSVIARIMFLPFSFVGTVLRLPFNIISMTLALLLNRRSGNLTARSESSTLSKHSEIDLSSGPNHTVVLDMEVLGAAETRNSMKISTQEPETKPKTLGNEADSGGSCPLLSKPPPTTDSAKWHHPTRNILNPMMKAIDEFGMIKHGDKVLLCLSGGKDSLSLLHALRQYQFISKNKKGVVFELGAVTVDPMTPTFNPAPLIPYLAELGVPYFFERQGILKKAEQMEEVASICSLCSRMKRGRIYRAARQNGYNVIAMGQHLDDLSESFLMSIFHNGLLRTMKANYTVTEGDLRVIRPLIYVRERDLRTFAETRHLPVIPENCPACFEEPKERHRVKQLLAQQELLFPQLASSLQRAMKPLYSKNRVWQESRTMPGGEEGCGGEDTAGVCENGDDLFLDGC